MGASRLVAGMAAVAAALAATPAWAQWNNEPYSYRSGGSVGMSNAYRQAYMDQQISGNRPRNLVRGPDGALVTVVEKDRQAFLATPQPNYLVNRGTTAAGVGIGVGGVALDGWAVPGVPGVPAAAGIGRAPIDAWTAQLDGLRAVQ